VAHRIAYTLCSIAALALGALTAPAHAEEPPPPGHYLSLRDAASGRTQVMDDTNSLFTIAGNSNRMVVSSSRRSGSPPSPGTPLSQKLVITVQAPVGETLKPGIYADAGCPGYPSGRVYRLEVTRNNPLCRGHDTVYGWVSIRQITFDSTGRPDSVEMIFSQRVGSPTAPLLSGLLRYDAYPKYFRLESGAAGPWGAISENDYGDTSYVMAYGDYYNFVVATSDAIKGRWQVTLRAPATGGFVFGRRIPVGNTRTDAVGLFAVFRDEQRQLCPVPSDLQGWFQVRAIAHRHGSILGAWINFEVRCGATGPRVIGEFRDGI